MALLRVTSASTDGEATPGAACPGGTSRTSPTGEQEKCSLPSHQLLTHHVEDALMVGHNDSRALHLEVLQSLHFKPQAEEILEGPDNSFDDSAEEKSSQQEGRKGWKETRRALGQRTFRLICAVLHSGLPCMVSMLQDVSVTCPVQVLGYPSATRLFLLQAAGSHKLFTQFSQQLPLPSTPNTQGRLCQVCSDAAQ